GCAQGLSWEMWITTGCGQHRGRLWITQWITCGQHGDPVDCRSPAGATRSGEGGSSYTAGSTEDVELPTERRSSSRFDHVASRSPGPRGAVVFADTMGCRVTRVIRWETGTRPVGHRWKGRSMEGRRV